MCKVDISSDGYILCLAACKNEIENKVFGPRENSVEITI